MTDRLSSIAFAGKSRITLAQICAGEDLQACGRRGGLRGNIGTEYLIGSLMPFRCRLG
jgi:hypothetical protein